MSILKNAIDSIQLGVEDQQVAKNEGKSKRNISAVRNICAGILLLYKEKLCRLSPCDDKELLIKQDFIFYRDEAGVIKLKAKGKKTVDTQAIRARFTDFGVNVDWKLFTELNKLRNNIEHYYNVDNNISMPEVIAKSFVLIRDFIREHLDDQPVNLIGGESWAILLKEAEIYKKEHDECVDSFENIDWQYACLNDILDNGLYCPICSSSLIECSNPNTAVYPNISLECHACGNKFQFEDIVEQCVETMFPHNYYLAFKENESPPYAKCPSCEKNTFIHDECCCISCDYQINKACTLCDERVGLDQSSNDGLCDNCQYNVNKYADD